MPRRRKNLARLILLCASLALAAGALLAAEFITRATKPYLNPMKVFAVAPLHVVNLEQEHNIDVYEYDAMRTWRLKPGLRNQPGVGTFIVATNRQFMRMDHDVGPKKAGQLRVVCMGDSVSFGCCVPFYWEGKWNASERFYAQYLEEKLREHFPGRNPEVVLLACPGYSSTQGRLWLEEVIDDLDPDIVTACYGWNDIFVAGPSDRQTLPQNAPERWSRELAERSQLFTRLIHWRNDSKPTETISFGLPRTSIEDYLMNFVEMNALVKKAGANFLIIAPVYRDKTTQPHEAERIAYYRKKLSILARDLQVRYLEIPELFEDNEANNQNLFADPSHPNSGGHEIMGDRITTEVMRMLGK